MLGGLAWCITASNVDVEADLLFDEEMTLGQKIKLGENVVAALRKMRCPARCSRTRSAASTSRCSPSSSGWSNR